MRWKIDESRVEQDDELVSSWLGILRVPNEQGLSIPFARSLARSEVGVKSFSPAANLQLSSLPEAERRRSKQKNRIDQQDDIFDPAHTRTHSHASMAFGPQS
jgi:hypothetical protein